MTDNYSKSQHSLVFFLRAFYTMYHVQWCHINPDTNNPYASLSVLSVRILLRTVFSMLFCTIDPEFQIKLKKILIALK